ncbi:hypothetical protein [Treponema primitia]|uniref:hypothetical protein n=1 Tax=Treponema primitia TaxID=88058 RepID=UPI00025552F0|nr:hypothetical protein [Treponema primitia]
MKKAALYSLVIIVSGLVVLSCATAGHGNSVRDAYVPAENPLIGEWQEEEYAYSFRPDGTFTARQDGEKGNKNDAYLIRGNTLITLAAGTDTPDKYIVTGTDHNVIELVKEGVPAVYTRVVHGNREEAPEKDGHHNRTVRADAFSGKNWNAPHINNMHDRWEFRDDGTFHFWHIHEGRPLDRGDYSYLISGNVFLALKEDLKTLVVYTFKFTGEETFTVSPVIPPGGRDIPFIYDNKTQP